MNSGGLVVIALLFALFWLFLIRPQRRRQVEQERILASLEVGDEVLTAGGLYGNVVALDGDEVRLEIAPGTEVRVARRAIAAVLEEDEEVEEGEDAEVVENDEDGGVAEASGDERGPRAERSAPGRES